MSMFYSFRSPYGDVSSIRLLAEQVFSRMAGVSNVPGNSVRILKDAKENYSTWLDAIGTAQKSIHVDPLFCCPCRYLFYRQLPNESLIWKQA